MVGSTFTNVIAREVSVLNCIKEALSGLILWYILCAIACFIIGKLDFEKFKLPINGI